MEPVPNSWVVYYGNDSIKLLQHKDLLRKKGFVFFKGDIKDLYSECFSSNLFNPNSSLIIDSSFIQPSDFEKIVKKGPSNKKNLAYFYNGTEIKSSFIKLFSKSIKFNLIDDRQIFKFLDRLFNNDLKTSLAFLTKFKKDEDKIYLINMVFFTIKSLFLYYYDLDSFHNLKPYIQLKTKQISSKIDKVSLKSILNFLSEADYRIKVSNDKDSVIFSTVFYLASIK